MPEFSSRHKPATMTLAYEPTPAEEAAERMLNAVRFRWASPVTAREAGDYIIGLARDIEAERARRDAPARRART